MTLPTWADRKGRASLVPLSKLQLLGVVRTAGGEEEEEEEEEEQEEEEGGEEVWRKSLK